MKKIISIICVAAMLALCLTACGEPKLDGTYKLITMESGGQDLSAMLGTLEVYMTVKDDQATVDFAGQTMTWEIDEENGVMRNEQGAESPYRVEENQIILENEEDGVIGRMVFEKVESTADSK
ncbi:MAG: hypothetical protein IJ639_10170 [Ruminococcus sp.]|nr:hypothetical protein [Ruminococcus sp.]